MPKFVIFLILGILLIGIIAGGALLVWQSFSANNGSSTKTSSDSPGPLFGALPQAPKADNKPPSPTPKPVDTDSDGLSDPEEATWKTDPNNPDTDNDGYLDGEEVAANHDPTIPAPDDLLTPSNTPPPAPNPSPQLSLTIEKYFSTDIDIYRGNTNLTEAFDATFSEEERSPTNLSKYADEQTIIDVLPEPEEEEITIMKNYTPEDLQQYLQVANNQSALANSVSYNSAQYSLDTYNDPSQMLGLANTVKNYRSALSNTPVPEIALPLHKLLLGYTKLLSTTFDQIAKGREDFVTSLVAKKQLRIIDRKYYPIINTELQRLQALQ